MVKFGPAQPGHSESGDGYVYGDASGGAEQPQGRTVALSVTDEGFTPTNAKVRNHRAHAEKERGDQVQLRDGDAGLAWPSENRHLLEELKVEPSGLGERAEELRREGQTVMFVGIDEIEAEVLPAQKGEVVKRLQSQGLTVAMAGDGINDYLAYTRPLSIPVTMVMVMTGWLASPSHARTFAGVARDVGLLVLVYSVLLWGGSNAFNSAEDRDEGPVNLLPNPPPIPPHLGLFGICLKMVGVLASAVFGLRCVAIATLAALVSVFYSWRGAPWRRGKEIPGIDNLINAGGCGFGSFLYGWCVTGEPLSWRMMYLGLAWTVCLFGGIPTAQIFQLKPGESVDSARNWTSWLGAAQTLRLGAVLFAAHFLLIAWVSPLRVTTLVWGASMLCGVVHSGWWSKSPFENAHGRMLRQMALLTTGQLAWAIGMA